MTASWILYSANSSEVILEQSFIERHITGIALRTPHTVIWSIATTHVSNTTSTSVNCSYLKHCVSAKLGSAGGGEGGVRWSRS